MTAFARTTTLFLLLAFAAPAMAQDRSAEGAVYMIAILFLLVGALLYFVPTAVAQYRKASNMTAVILINLLLGWTMIGWVVALIMAFAGDSGEAAKRHREMMEALNRQNNQK